MSYYRQSPDMNVYDRGPANMLGKVLIFVFIAIVLTGVAVLGFANVLQDAARMRQIDSQTQHQEALWAAAAPYEQQKAAADANYDIAATNAAGTRALAQADADAIRARADAQAYANQQALAAYQTAVRGQQALDREKLIGQIAIYAGGLLIVTADHGGHGTGHGTTDPLDMTIPWVIAGPRIRQDYAITAAVSTMDTAATAAFLLGLTLPADVGGKPVLEAFAPVGRALSPLPENL